MDYIIRVETTPTMTEFLKTYRLVKIVTRTESTEVTEWKWEKKEDAKT